MLASTTFTGIAESVPVVRRFAFAILTAKSKVYDSDGGHSSMVELQIVVLVVAGSSPVGHPVFVKCRFHCPVLGRGSFEGWAHRTVA